MTRFFILYPTCWANAQHGAGATRASSGKHMYPFGKHMEKMRSICTSNSTLEKNCPIKTTSLALCALPTFPLSSGTWSLEPFGKLWYRYVVLSMILSDKNPNILNRRGVQQMHECCTCICPYNLMISMTNSIFTDMWIYSHEPDLSFGSLHFELMPSMRRALLEPAQGSTRTLSETVWKKHVLYSPATLHWKRIADKSKLITVGHVKTTNLALWALARFPLSSGNHLVTGALWQVMVP